MRIAGFYENSCTNGEGWRSVIFVGGCPHKCEGCQNPQTWDYNYGEKVEDVNFYIEKILKNKKLIDGLTISGGEPFQERNIEPLLELIKPLKEEGLNIWCYTGYKYEELLKNSNFKKLLAEIDVLVDGPFVKEEYCPNIKFRGSKNQRVLDIPRSLQANEIIEIA